MLGKTFGHYQITGKIGKGGMGEVFRARDTRLDRDVAIKFLPEDMATDPERIARFEREARAVAALQHPNIVTIHSVETIDGRSCITMELVEGKTLAELIPPGGMTLDKFFDIAIPLSDALRAAHAKGITHRDLKPSNVMVDQEGRLRVLDFGLAKLLAAPGASGETTVGAGDVTAEGKIIGTVNYMSPEQAEAKPLDHRSDIFSLGVVLYEMATGMRPFKGDTPISTVSSILKEKPASVTELRENLPRHLGRVINRCLEKNPEKRFQTARDVCNELEGLQKEVESGDVEQSVSASMSRSSMNLDLPARRKAWLPVAAGVVVVAAVAGYFLFVRKPAPDLALNVTTRPMTGSVGVEVAGSWSPDGGFFAYSHSQSGPTDIFVVAAAGGDPITLVKSDADDITPRWSPDNRWVAFASNRGGKTGVYLVPPLGGQVQKLVDTGGTTFSSTLYGTLGMSPWSPDAHRLLFSRADEAGVMSIWAIEMDTRKETQLTTAEPNTFDYAASYSPDGKQILYAHTTGTECVVRVMPAAGGPAREVVRETAQYVFPSWLPDGARIVYSISSGGIWMADVGSGRKRQVLVLENDTQLAVARDGRILYDKSSHQTDLYLQDINGGKQERLTFHTQDNFGPQVSPDGERVAYSSSRTGNAEIWIIDRKAGSERQLTNRPADDWEPCWSPDGREIAFVSDQDGDYRLWVVAADGGALRMLGSNRITGAGPRWAPDGSSIGIISNAESGNALFLVDPKDGTSRKVLDRVNAFDWYRDTNHVVYSVEGPGNEMRVGNLETGESAVLLTTPFTEFRVAPDGSAVDFCTALSHSNMNLFLLPLAPPAAAGALPRPAGPPRAITDGRGEWHVHNGGWSPDSKQVIYTRDTDTGDIYLLEGVM
jgi:Tol biopolymer transport system component